MIQDTMCYWFLTFILFVEKTTPQMVSLNGLESDINGFVQTNTGLIDDLVLKAIV